MMELDRSNRTLVFIVMIAVLLLAFGLRLHRIAYDAIWWDEGYSVWMARMSIPEMLQATARDTHPPLSYALLHGWRALVGDEEFALRSLSVCFGLLTVAVTYQAGRSVGGRWAGLTAALLTAVARLPVWWSQEIRMYAPVMFFAMLAVLAAIRLLHGQAARWMWAAILGIALAGGMLSLYLFAGVLVAINLAFPLAFFTSQDRWKLTVAWAVAHVGALIPVVIWLAYALPTIPSWGDPQPAADPWFVIQLFLSSIFVGQGTSIDRYMPALIVGALLLLGGLGLSFWHSHQHPQRRAAWLLLAICTVLPPILVYLIALPRGEAYNPSPAPRYFVLLAAPLYVLLGWSIALASRHWRHAGSLLTGLLLLFSGWGLASYYPGLRSAEDYPAVVATIHTLRGPNDAVVLNNDTDWPIFAYYYGDDFDRQLSKTRRIWDEAYVEGLFADYYETHEGVWLVQTQYAPQTDPDNIIDRWMTRESWDQRRFTFPNSQLIFYGWGNPRGLTPQMDLVDEWPANVSEVSPIELADGLTLQAFSQPMPEVMAGDFLTVGLGWHANAIGEWPVRLQLVDRQGVILSELPFTMVGTGSPNGETRYQPIELFVPPDAPGGRFRLAIATDDTWHALDSLSVLPRRSGNIASASVPPSATQIGATFGDAISLLAVELPEQRSYQPGDQIPLTLYWQAETVIPERYKVFTHVVGSEYNRETDSTIWGQFDQEPQGGGALTSTWRAGQVIADAYLIPLQSDAPSGVYRVQMGLYLPIERVRLPIRDVGQVQATPDHALILFEIEIAP
ncbi:MAG: hypothetical protein GYB68_16925 [Chloroflexi bacterium]|nr:hypothetical protein [Chloroflexota bacterium]